MTPKPTDTQLTSGPAGSYGPAPKRIPVEALLGSGREVVIVHAGREYRLRVTQNGRLILTA